MVYPIQAHDQLSGTHWNCGWTVAATALISSGGTIRLLTPAGVRQHGGTLSHGLAGGAAMASTAHGTGVEAESEMAGGETPLMDQEGGNRHHSHTRGEG